jgi:hypothetical protein
MLGEAEYTELDIALLPEARLARRRDTADTASKTATG